MEQTSTTRPSEAPRRELENRRVIALAATLLLHAALLLLLGADAVSVPLARPQAIQVRLIDDARGLAAGKPNERPTPRMPSAAPARGDTPRAGLAHTPRAIVAHRSAPPAAVVEAASVPPPAIAMPELKIQGAPSDTATRPRARSGAPGADGNGRNGSDLAGSMRRIAFARKVLPEPPRAFRRSMPDAWALIGVHVDAQGNLRDTRILRSSGYAELDAAARKAATQSRYVPHLRDGKPVMFWGLVPYTFGKAEPEIDRALAEAGFDRT